MVVSISGYLFLFVGLLLLALPLMLVELSRPRDWLMGGLFLFLGLFLLVENDLLRGSNNLLVISMAILYGKMMSEIFQNRWYQLGSEEKKRIASFERWIDSFKQLGQILFLFGNSFLNFFKNFKKPYEKSLKEKKWIRPEVKDETKKSAIDSSNSSDIDKSTIKESSENEESS